VKTKGRSSKVHHTTYIKQNGVEAEESAIIHIHLSGHRCTFIKQEMKGEESLSLDFKQ